MRSGAAQLYVCLCLLMLLPFLGPFQQAFGFPVRAGSSVRCTGSQSERSTHESYAIRGFIGDHSWDIYDDDDASDDEGSLGASRYAGTDWMEAEQTLRQAPSEPHPDLDAYCIALTVCRSLQWADYPEPAAGLVRSLPFLTFECRKAVTARQGGDTPDRFAQYGLLSPALQPLMGASRVTIGGATRTLAAPLLLGELASLLVDVTGVSAAALQHHSSLPRGGVAVGPPHTRLVMRLERQRRPPLQDCWLIRELMDVRQAFAGDTGNAGVAG